MRRALVAVGLIALVGVALARRSSTIDRQTGTVTAIVDGDALDVRLDDGRTLRVRLLGVDAPDGDGLKQKSIAYLTARTSNGRVALRQDEVTRPGAAYVYLADNELLNEAIVRDGWAFADRTRPCDFSGLIEQSENAARSAKRGMWRTMTLEEMPAWRQAWMRDRGLK